MDAAYAYLAVLALVWWAVLEPALGFEGRMYAAAAATGLLTVLFTLCLSREATRNLRETAEKYQEAFRRHVYDLCAGLILVLRMCQQYSEEDARKMREELRVLHSGVEDFARQEFSAPTGAAAGEPRQGPESGAGS